MNLTKAQLKAQYNRAVRLGWLPYFQEAAEITEGFYDVADLLAIGSRETNLDPKWLKKSGDHGNGFGLMQADKRSFPEFTKGDGWKDARTGIIFGAKVLMQKQVDYENNVGKHVSVKSSKGGTYRFTGKLASGTTMQHIVISGYNCGRWSQYAYAKGQPIDKYSTGGDYGKDVMERAAEFRKLLTAASNRPVSQPDPSASLQTQVENTADLSPSIVKAEPVVDPINTQTVTMAMPTLKRAWSWLGSLSGFGFLGTTYAALNGMPTWAVLLIGLLAGAALVGLIVVVINHRNKIAPILSHIAETNADPTLNNIEVVK